MLKKLGENLTVFSDPDLLHHCKGSFEGEVFCLTQHIKIGGGVVRRYFQVMASLSAVSPLNLDLSRG